MKRNRFIALTPPDDFSDEVRKLQAEHARDRNVRQALQPHITLVNPRELVGINPEHAKKSISGVAETITQFTVELDLVTHFSDLKTIYIRAESQELEDMRKDLQDELGFEAERPRYNAHLTLLWTTPSKTFGAGFAKGIEREARDRLSIPTVMNEGNLVLFHKRGTEYEEEFVEPIP